MKYHAKKHITAAISYVITIFRVVCFKKANRNKPKKNRRCFAAIFLPAGIRIIPFKRIL